MPWPPNQPPRENLSEQDEFYWDAVIARGAMASEATLRMLAMVYDRAEGPDRALFTGDLAAGWDGVERDSLFFDPEKRAIPYGQLLHCPEFAWHVANLGALNREGSPFDTLSPADCQWVSQVIYVETGISYIQRVHVPEGLAAGIRQEAIEALHDGREWDLTERERLLTAFIRAVLNQRMTAELWLAMEAQLGEAATVHYAIRICVHVLVSMLTRALNFYPEYTTQTVDRWVQAFRDGTVEAPNYAPKQPVDEWLETWGARRLFRDAHH